MILAGFHSTFTIPLIASLTELGGIRYDETNHNIQVKIGDVWYNVMHFDPTELVALVPAMTSTTTPSGEVIISSELSSAMGYMAFDRNSSTGWETNNDADPYIGYHFDTPRVVKQVSYTNNSNSQNPTYGISAFAFKASNDGSNWTTLGNFTIQSLVASTNQVFDINNDNGYTYYALFRTAGGYTTGYMFGPSELQFIGY